MNNEISPSLLFFAALMLGAGLYLIQRSRFLVPALMRRHAFLGTRPQLARNLLLFLLTLGILLGGISCRVILMGMG